MWKARATDTCSDKEKEAKGPPRRLPTDDRSCSKAAMRQASGEGPQQVGPEGVRVRQKSAIYGRLPMPRPDSRATDYPLVTAVVATIFASGNPTGTVNLQMTGAPSRGFGPVCVTSSQVQIIANS